MDLVAALGGMGFTQSEAKVYLVLLRNNPATGYQLSKVSGVPRSMVYEALGRLDARGAVLKSREAKATLYRPLPPQALLESVDTEHHRKMQALSGGLSEIYAAFYNSWAFPIIPLKSFDFSVPKVCIYFDISIT